MPAALKAEAQRQRALVGPVVTAAAATPAQRAAAAARLVDACMLELLVSGGKAPAAASALTAARSTLAATSPDLGRYLALPEATGYAALRSRAIAACPEFEAFMTGGSSSPLERVLADYAPGGAVAQMMAALKVAKDTTGYYQQLPNGQIVKVTP